MVNMVISPSGIVTGDNGKIIAYEGQSHSEIISIIHPLFSGCEYYIEYKYDNTIYRNKLNSDGQTQIEIGNAGYVKCSFLAIDIETTEIIFRSNAWSFIIKENLKVQPSHYPCSTMRHRFDKCSGIHKINNDDEDFNSYEAYTKLSNELENEEQIRFSENQEILKVLNKTIDDINIIKEKLKIYEPDEYMKKLNIQKIEDYLYEITFNDYDYQKGMEYLKQYNSNVQLGACSSVHNGFIRGRNFDWNYNEIADFVIKVPKTDDRYGSIGVAHGIGNLTNSFVNTKQYSDMYQYLPFFTLDGMNSAGLIVNVNSLPAGDNGHTINTNPTAKDTVCTLMITRLLLDKASSVEEAITLLNSKNIFAPNSDKLVDEQHFMISDATGAEAIIEFIYNEAASKIEMNVLRNKNIMTNFYLTNYDGTRDSLTPHAMGIERYNILNTNYNMSNTVRGMIELMKKVYFTKTYDLYMNPFWYSDYSGHYETYGDLTKDNIGETYLNGDTTNAGDYKQIIDKLHEYFEIHARDNKLWQTVHTSVYDWTNKKLIVLAQEGSIEHEFNLLDL